MANDKYINKRDPTFNTGPHDRLTDERGQKKGASSSKKKRKKYRQFNSGREAEFKVNKSSEAPEYSKTTGKAFFQSSEDITKTGETIKKKGSSDKKGVRKKQIGNLAYDISTTSFNIGKAVSDASDISDDRKDVSEEATGTAGQVVGRRLYSRGSEKKSSVKIKESKPSGRPGKLKFSNEEIKGEAGIKGKNVESKASNTGTEKTKPSKANPYRTKSISSNESKVKASKFQKQKLKKSYATALNKAKRGETVKDAAGKAVKSIGEKARTLAIKVVKNNTPVIAVAAVAGIFIMGAISLFTSVGGVLSESGGSFVTSTYLGSDDDITAANSNYEELERRLQTQIDNIEGSYPGYDEYRYQVDEISHDPFALTSYLTVLYQDYKEADVQSAIEDLFANQFDLSLNESVEQRQREVDNGDGTTSIETYEVKILTIVLQNKGIEAIALASLTEDDLTLYNTYQAVQGNRAYLFSDYIVSGSGGSGGGIRYEIPPEALSDERFANMINEAQKHLGKPYVWGGYSPISGFDCSGFVSYVINNCGNGWNLGRQTANGLMSNCTYISPSEAKPGDLIFFEKTYNTSGASHVGIYVGDGMMIHCGNPIQFTSINSNYWKSHFLTFGRL